MTQRLRLTETPRPGLAPAVRFARLSETVRRGPGIDTAMAPLILTNGVLSIDVSALPPAPLPANVATDEEVAAAVAGVTVASIGAVAATDARLTDARTPLAHSQAAATITDLDEAVQDLIGAYIAAGANVTKTYDDITGVTTLSVVAPGEWTNTDPEVVRDVIGGALAAGPLITIAVNDVGDTITVSTSATANSADAALRDRATHTGAQAIATITGLQAALDAKVAGTDARLSDARAPLAHAASHASGAADPVTPAAIGAAATVHGDHLTNEAVQDLVAAMIAAGANITAVYDDVAGTLTIGTTGLALSGHAHTLDSEAVQDAVAAMVLAGPNVTAVYDDVAGTLTIGTTGLATSTHTHALDTEGVQDAVAAMLVAGATVTLVYDDVAGTLTVNTTGLQPISARNAANGYAGLEANGRIADARSNVVASTVAPTDTTLIWVDTN